jgi:hypothetical protein
LLHSYKGTGGIFEVCWNSRGDLKNIGQLTDAISSKALGFMETGYQKELTYKRDDGSFSAFG